MTARKREPDGKTNPGPVAVGAVWGWAYSEDENAPPPMGLRGHVRKILDELSALADERAATLEARYELACLRADNAAYAREVVRLKGLLAGVSEPPANPAPCACAAADDKGSVPKPSRTFRYPEDDYDEG